MKKLKVGPATALIFVLITGLLHVANASAKPYEEQRKVVETFCRLDLDGGLLSTENSKRSGIFDYISLSEGPFPAWDTATLVAGYRILSVSSHSDSAKVLLQYDVIGEISSEELVITKKEEKSHFRLRRVNGTWKIIDPNNLRPHILVETAISHLQHLIDSKSNESPEIPKVIEKLKTLQAKAQREACTGSAGNGASLPLIPVLADNRKP